MSTPRATDHITGLRRLTVAQACEVSQLSETTIRQALATGELAGHQRVKGGRWLIKPAALTAWMDGDEHPGAS